MTVLRDSWLVFRRQTFLLLRNPVWVIAGVLQPLFFVLLFAPLLPTVLGVDGTGAAYAVFVPGLLVLTAIFSALYAGLGLIAETRSGILERCQVTPVSRLALLLGRCGRDAVTIALQAALIVAISTAFGMRVAPADLLLALALLVGVAVTLSAVSYGLAVHIGDEQAMSSLMQTVTQPIVLLSGVMLPLSLAPGWMTALATWNPLAHVVTAQRALFAGHHGDPAVWHATLVIAVLAVIALGWATAAFVRAAR